MAPYWLIFCIPIMAVIAPFRFEKSIRSILWFLFFLLLTIFIGLREEVGGDWRLYLKNFNNISVNFHPLEFNFLHRDYGYNLVTWIFYQLKGEIYSVNFFNALIFMLGLTSYALRQRQPALTFVIAIPYLVIVVATGYTRQATAIGFLFLGINSLVDNKWRLFIVYIFLAAMFHKTAIIMSFLVLMVSPKINFKIIFYLISFLLLYYYFVLRVELGNYLYYFVGKGMHFSSSGALMRFALSLLASIICIIYRRNLSDNLIEKRLYLSMAIIIILSSFFVYSYSSAVDRILLYFMPIQLFIFSRLHILFQSLNYRQVFNICVICVYALVLFVWLNLGKFAVGNWIPYNTVLF